MQVFRNARVIDGSGNAGFRGDVLIDGDRITLVSPGRIEAPGAQSIDCTGMVLAPGFIDLHSHNDWFLTVPETQGAWIDPFLRQGITTFVTGNCGFGVAGFKSDTCHKGLLENNLFKAGHRGLRWNSFAEYYALLESQGLPANLACLTGSGSTRTSICGYEGGLLSQADRSQYDGLLRKAMDDGAIGLSYGMGYAPDIFFPYDELVRGAKFVAQRGGLVSIHARAFSKVSGAYPLLPFGTPHNLLALKECIALARDSGAKLQISHLIFVGKRTWPTVDAALSMIDRARADGVDVAFDTYAHHSGATVITGILPDWVMARLPAGYDDARLMRRVKYLMLISFALLGFGFGDIRLAAGNHPELEPYNGLYFDEIAKARGLGQFENYIDIAKKSESTARLLIDKYSNPDLVATLMRHPAAHFITDAWIEPAGLQNPAALGGFPLFLERAREGVISLEEAVRKMTGANADRASLQGRGYIRAGSNADIVVFDAASVQDCSASGKAPNGIAGVWVNGVRVIKDGHRIPGIFSGQVLRRS